MLTPQQLATLKTWLTANAASLNDEQARDALNATTSPVFVIYRNQVYVEEVMTNGFDWTRVDNLSVGKARIWEWMTKAKKINDAFVFDPSKSQIRSGINEAWKGTAADLAVRAAIYIHCVRNATVAEKLLATGSGTSPDQDGNGPGTTTLLQPITTQDVVDALNSAG